MTKTIANLAWIEDPCKGDNEHCLRAIAAGRPVHIIPHFQDPRAVEFVLALPDYHFATETDALAGLEEGWATARIAYTFAERDAAYADGVPVIISRDIVKNSKGLGNRER